MKDFDWEVFQTAIGQTFFIVSISVVVGGLIGLLLGWCSTPPARAT